MCLMFKIAPMTLEIDIQVAHWFKILRKLSDTLPVEDYDIGENYYKTVKEVSENKKKFYANGMIIYILDDYYEELVVLNNSVIRTFAERVRAHKKRLLS